MFHIENPYHQIRLIHLNGDVIAMQLPLDDVNHDVDDDVTSIMDDAARSIVIVGYWHVAAVVAVAAAVVGEDSPCDAAVAVTIVDVDYVVVEVVAVAADDGVASSYSWQSLPSIVHY